MSGRPTFLLPDLDGPGTSRGEAACGTGPSRGAPRVRIRGYLLSNGVAQLVTDGAIQAEQSSAFADDFGRNQVRLRVEGRFDLAVTRPMGVVRMTLAAA